MERVEKYDQPLHEGVVYLGGGMEGGLVEGAGQLLEGGGVVWQAFGGRGKEWSDAE